MTTPTPAPVAPPKDGRNDIVTIAVSSVPLHKSFTYSQGPHRMDWRFHPGLLPVQVDCSSYATMVYYMAGCVDPNGLSYDGAGYTGTLLSNKHNTHISMAQATPGDLVVYGAGTGEHVAVIVQVKGNDILTVSMGQNGDPSFVWVNRPKGLSKGYAIDGRQPQTFLRCNTVQVRTPVRFKAA